MDMDLLTNIFYAMIRTGTPLLLVASASWCARRPAYSTSARRA